MELKYFVVLVIPAENRTWLPDSTELEVFTRVHFTNTELELTFCCEHHRYEYVSSRTWRMTSPINLYANYLSYGDFFRASLLYIDAVGGVTYDPAVVRSDNEMKVFLHRNAINPRDQSKPA